MIANWRYLHKTREGKEGEDDLRSLLRQPVQAGPNPAGDLRDADAIEEVVAHVRDDRQGGQGRPAIQLVPQAAVHDTWELAYSQELAPRPIRPSVPERGQDFQGSTDTAAQPGQDRREPHLQVAGPKKDHPQGGGGSGLDCRRVHRSPSYRVSIAQDAELPYTIVAMSNQPDRYEAEALRLVKVLASLAEEKRASIRSLEKKMGVGESVFSKVLRGKVTLQVRHVLMLADALEIGWSELFARAYRQAQPRPVSTAAEEEERKMIRLLLRLGLIDDETARKAMASAV
jgi:transcriptional regulator with XRE-family HTH domain